MKRTVNGEVLTKANKRKITNMDIYIQWNLSNPDTNGAEESVLFSEVSSFRNVCKSGIYLGWEKVSCLERCPQFRGVLMERFNCTMCTSY